MYQGNYRDFIAAVFDHRKKRNPSYSMRAFARDLDINPTTLSEVLAKKRDFSKSAAMRVASALELSEQATKKILSELGFSDDREFVTPDEDTLSNICEWHFLAILSLAKLPHSQASPDWVSSHLGISKQKAQQALSTLEKNHLISTHDGYLRRTTADLSSSVDIPSEALRHYHDSILRKARVSLQETPLHLRDFATTTMAVDTARLPKAKQMIFDFRRKLSNFLEGGTPDTVYAFSVQTFPLTTSHPENATFED